MSPSFRSVGLLCCLALGWLSVGNLQAQEATPPAAAAEEAKPVKIDREQTIYIPYTKLRDVFEKEGRGVFLPYEKFQALWKAARDREPIQPEKRPPVSSLVTQIESEATVGKDVVRVSAKLQIEVLAEGWNEVPLGLADAAIQTARLGNEPARLAFDPQQGYKLLVKNEGKEPKQVELAIEYAKAFTKAPGANSVAFQAPQAPVNRWRIRIPDEGVKVNVHPLLVATEVPHTVAATDGGNGDEEEEEFSEDEEQPETVVLAFVGASPTVRIEWTPKAEGATGLAALATVQAQQEVTIEEGVVRTRARLAYEITRAEQSQLEIEVPADQKVVNVFDANVRQWEVRANDETQTIRVQLFEATRGTQQISVELEKFEEEEASRSVSIPMVKALGVGRQQGLVVVRLSPELRAEVAQRSGLLQIDAGELPQSLASGKWSFAYRYAALPYELVLEVQKVEPRVVADELVEVYLEPHQLTSELLALYTIERAGLFQLELSIPDGFEVRQVRGQAAAGAEAASVDTYHVEGETDRKLLVNLARKALGRIGLAVQFVERLDDPNLLTPTGQSSEITLALPRIEPASIERTRGRLIVYAPENLRVNPASLAGLTSISHAEALQGVESQCAGRFAELRPILSYAFTQEPATLSLSVERRKPQVTVAQLLAAQVDSGVVKYDAKFHYDIRYSGVKSLRIDVPTPLATMIRNQTAGVREKTIEPQPDDVAEGYTAWSFSGDSDFIGSRVIHLTWEQKIETLEIGTSVRLELPVLRPQEVDRAWGQIVLAKSETIDLAPASEPTGLRPIDPQHDLMPSAQAPQAARAFEFHDDWSLALLATRYKLEDVKTTSVERGVVRMVATRSGQLAVQALYRVRSAEQRLAVELPANAAFDTQPLKLNGKPASLERGSQNELFIPLVGQSPEQPFLLELRYTIPQRSSRFDVPEFPAPGGQTTRPAVQKIYLCAYFPEDETLLGARGPWNEELVWRDDGTLGKRPQPRQSDAHLVSWVQEGVPAAGSVMDQFQIDGQMYLFSTLAPEPSPDGSLRLFTLDENWLHTLAFTTLLVVGLLLVRRPLPQKLAALALAIIAAVLLGVFLPIFSRQLLGGVLIAAIALVLLAWVAWHALFARPRWLTSAWASAPAAGSSFASPPPIEAPPSEPAPASQQPDQPHECQDEGGSHHA